VKLIIFLGNPGLRYRKTRHNVGFMIGDVYAKKLGLKWKKEVKFGAEIARDGDILLAKPQLFYNLTGDSVAKIMNFYKIARSNLLVVCDDINLNFGKIRFRADGSDGGNNGLKSIIQHLGQDFARIRVGTDNGLRTVIGNTDFVLSRLSRTEQSELDKISANVVDLIDEKLT
jgi:PTH1 family peptidyl-tRNA hydrolase